jgi:DNA-binding NarL/FixJ family response regulator
LSSHRILVVEDFEPFRRLICSELQKRAEFQLTEASNGWEALQKAKNKPDLVLLDIGLPDLSGMVVARHLQGMAVPPKIVFVTLETSSDVVREAFSPGALGYVQKTRAHSDLLPAVEAALKGMLFVGAGLEFNERANGSTRPHQRLREISANLTSLTNLPDLLNGILDAAIEISAADFGTVQIYDQKTGELKLMAYRGFGPAFVKFFETIRDDSCCCCGAALKAGTRIVVEDVATDPVFDAEARGIVLSAEVRAIQSTPIYSQDAILCGMLATHYRRPYRPNDSTLKVLDALALQASNFIQRINSPAQ